MNPVRETYGTALVVSGPSGTGKTTVCKALLNRMPELHFSISCTTRSKRPGEEDGVDYHFLTKKEFQERIRANAFLEYAEVHGNFYGTLRAEVEDYVDGGNPVLLDIDVQGARQVRTQVRHTRLEQCIEYVFVGPPSYAEMERRLRDRGTEADETIRQRLGNARGELAAWKEYDYLVINDHVERAVDDLHAIFRATATNTKRRRGEPWPDLETYHDR